MDEKEKKLAQKKIFSKFFEKIAVFVSRFSKFPVLVDRTEKSKAPSSGGKTSERSGRMANQLRKLKKRQLLELLVSQGKDLEATRAELEDAEKYIASLQKQIAGLEGRLTKLGASVRKIPREGAAQNDAAAAQQRATAPENAPAAEKERPEGDGDPKPSADQ